MYGKRWNKSFILLLMNEERTPVCFRQVDRLLISYEEALLLPHGFFGKVGTESNEVLIYYAKDCTNSWHYNELKYTTPFLGYSYSSMVFPI